MFRNRLIWQQVLRWLALLLLGIESFAAAAFAADDPQQFEYKIKAAYLYNFTKFTKWPLQNEAPREDRVLTICILGTDPFGEHIDGLGNKTTSGMPVVISHIDQPPQADQCQVLYISQSEKDNLKQVLQAVAGTPVLTVSDLEGFALNGGCIELLTSKGRVVFRVWLQAAQRAQLKLSAQLLELARVVIDP